MAAQSVVLLAGLFSLVSSKQAPLATPLACSYRGAIFGTDVGGQKKGVMASNSQHCQSMCQVNDCIGYTYHENSQKCYLKSDISYHNTTMGSWVSGFSNKGCQNGECMQYGYMLNGDADVSTQDSYLDCKLECQNSSGACTIYSYDQSTKECKQFSSITGFEHTYQDSERYIMGTAACDPVCFKQGVVGAGTAVKSDVAIDPEACQAICKNDPECGQFTLLATQSQTPDGRFQMSYSCELYAAGAGIEYSQSNPFSVSGPKECWKDYQHAEWMESAPLPDNIETGADIEPEVLGVDEEDMAPSPQTDDLGGSDEDTRGLGPIDSAPDSGPDTAPEPAVDDEDEGDEEDEEDEPERKPKTKGKKQPKEKDESETKTPGSNNKNNKGSKNKGKDSGKSEKEKVTKGKRSKDSEQQLQEEDKTEKTRDITLDDVKEVRKQAQKIAKDITDKSGKENGSTTTSTTAAAVLGVVATAIATLW